MNAAPPPAEPESPTAPAEGALRPPSPAEARAPAPRTEGVGPPPPSSGSPAPEYPRFDGTSPNYDPSGSTLQRMPVYETVQVPYQPPGYYPPPSQYPPYDPRPFMIRPLRGYRKPIIATLVAMILLIAVLALPWYWVFTKSKGHSSSESRADFKFDEIEVEYKSDSGSGSVSQTWESYTNSYKEANKGAQPTLPMLYTATFIFALLTMIFSILAFTTAMLGWLGLGPVRFREKLRAFVNITAVICLVNVIMFAALHQPALRADTVVKSDEPGPENSLIGTHSTEFGEYTWLPGIGWFLTLSVAILLLAAFYTGRRTAPLDASGRSVSSVVIEERAEP